MNNLIFRPESSRAVSLSSSFYGVRLHRTFLLASCENLFSSIHLALGQFEGKEVRCFDLEYMIGLVVIYFAGLVWRFIFLFAISVFFFFFLVR